MLRLFLFVILTAGLTFGCSKGRSGSTGSEASLPELNRALQAWLMAKGAAPQAVSDLTNFPALQGKRLPTPPPGQKLAIDPATRQVVFVAQ